MCLWLWIIVCYDQPVIVNHRWYAEPVVMYHGVLCWDSGCESWCVMLSQWLWIMVCYAEPVVVNHGVLCWASVVNYVEIVAVIMACYASMVVNHSVLCQPVMWMVCYSASGCESWCVCYDEPGCESWCAMLSQWLWIMVCYDEPVVVNRGIVMLRQWLWIMVCYAEPVVVNHGVLCWASGCELWCAMLSQWLWIMSCYSEPVLWIMMSYLPVVVNHGVLCCACGCES